MAIRRRYGITYDGKEYRTLICTVTGVMADGTKVWQECDPVTRETIDPDHWYILQTRNNWSEFVRQ